MLLSGEFYGQKYSEFCERLGDLVVPDGCDGPGDPRQLQLLLVLWCSHHHLQHHYKRRFISDALLYKGIWEEGIVTNVIKAAKLYEVKPHHPLSPSPC